MYLVIEIQKFSDTQVSVVTPVITRENELEAESEYHRLLSIAAVSFFHMHLQHSCMPSGLKVNR